MTTEDSFKLLYTAITQGLICGFSTAALIGPINFMAIRRGMLGGFQSTFLVGAGAALVDATCALAIFAGLSKVGFTGAWKIILGGISVTFLLYLAYSMLVEIRDNPEMLSSSKVKNQIRVLDHPFVMGFVLAATNPFTLIWWIGMVGTLKLYEYGVTGTLDPLAGAPTSFFSAVLVSELVWFSCLGLGVHYSRNLFDRRVLKVITWATALMLLFYYCFMAVKVFLNLVRTGGMPFLQ